MELPPTEQAQRLAEVRRTRYGYLLALHIRLLCAAQRTPTELAAVLFCSRSTVYRVVAAYRAGQWNELGEEETSDAVPPRRRASGLSPALQRSVRAILPSGPRLCGGWRTRWSRATIAGELSIRRKLAVSAETRRRWRPAVDWEWKRAKRRAKDDDPPRVEKRARIRYAWEQLRAGVTRFFADELDSHLVPKGGSPWMPKGTQVEVLTPGTNEKRSLGGAVELTTGPLPPWGWYRKTTGLFLDLLNPLARTHPAPLSTPLTGVGDTAKIHPATNVQKWLAAPPRFELLSLPTYCPRANPLERAFGDGHDKCTRTHTRKQMWQLVQDVPQHLQVKGPWQYALSELSSTPEVSAAVAALRAAHTTHVEISQLAA